MGNYSPHFNIFEMNNLHTILFPCVSLFSSCSDSTSLFAFALMSKNLTVVLNNVADQKCSFGQNCCPNAFTLLDDLPQKLPYHWRRIVIITKNLENIPKAEFFGWKDIIIITNTTILRLTTHVGETRHFSKFEHENKKDKINLMGRKLKVVGYDCPPLMTINEFGAEGYDVQILKEMSKKFNFTWEIEIPKGINKYGTDVNDRWVGGIRGYLADNLADIGVCGNWIFNKSLAALDICYGTVESQVRLFVPKATRVDRWYSLITPFTPGLWISIILTMLAITIIYKYLLSINGISVDLTWAFFETYSIFFGNYSVYSKQQNIALITITFSIFSILMTNIYSSEIVSRLTNVVYNKEIDTVQDLVTNGLFWGRMNNYTDMGIILNFEKTSHREIVKKFKVIKNELDCLKHIRSNKYALYGDLIGVYDLAYTLSDCQLTVEDWRNLRVMKEVLKTYFCGISFQKYSPLTQQTNRLNDGGLLAKMYSDSINKFGKKTMVYVKTPRDIINEPKPLSLNNMQGAFYSLLIGLLTSLIVFMIEMCLK